MSNVCQLIGFQVTLPGENAQKLESPQIDFNYLQTLAERPCHL